MIRGLVLAGGKSSRFGTDKAMVMYEGMSLLQRAVLLLASLRLQPVVVTRPGADHSPDGCSVIYDKLPGKGPLGGLYTAMSFFKNTSFLVLPCDMPALTPGALLDLLMIHKPHFGITAYSIGSQLQPFPGVYESCLFEAVRARLEQDKRSMQGLLDLVSNKKIIAWNGPRENFRNINQKDDLIAGHITT